MWNKSPLALSPLTFTLLACSRLNGTMEQHYQRLILVILSPRGPGPLPVVCKCRSAALWFSGARCLFGWGVLAEMNRRLRRLSVFTDLTDKNWRHLSQNLLFVLLMMIDSQLTKSSVKMSRLIKCVYIHLFLCTFGGYGWGGCDLPQIQTWNKQKCYVYIMFSTSLLFIAPSSSTTV